MHDAWRWQIALNAAFHLLPCEAVSRTTPSQALKPETTDLSIEDLHGPRVSGHPVVGVVPSQHGPQPSSITVDGPVHARAELFLDLSEFGEPAATFRLSPDDEGPVLSSAVTKVCEPEEVERFRLSSPRLRRLPAANLPNSIRRVLSGCRLSAKRASLS